MIISFFCIFVFFKFFCHGFQMKKDAKRSRYVLNAAASVVAIKNLICSIIVYGVLCSVQMYMCFAFTLQK